LKTVRKPRPKSARYFSNFQPAVHRREETSISAGGGGATSLNFKVALPGSSAAFALFVEQVAAAPAAPPLPLCSRSRRHAPSARAARLLAHRSRALRAADRGLHRSMRRRRAFGSAPAHASHSSRKTCLGRSCRAGELVHPRARRVTACGRRAGGCKPQAASQINQSIIT